MSRMQPIAPTAVLAERPFTHPRHIAQDAASLRYLATHVCLLLKYRYFSGPPPHIVHLKLSEERGWILRAVLADPEGLRQTQPLTIVGFFGQRHTEVDEELAQEFDRTLIAEIPEHPGLLCYSTMAVAGGNFANLVLFAHRQARDHWSTSQAHAQAVTRLAPRYYRHVMIYNGHLAGGLEQPERLQLERVKYFDYESTPVWRGVRPIGPAAAGEALA